MEITKMVVASAGGRPYRFGMKNRLTELRERKGIESVAELARLVGAKPPEVWRLEKWPEGNDSRKMTVKWAERLAPVLGVRPEELLFGDDAAVQTLATASSPKTAAIRGTVAANQWFTDEEFIDEDQPPAPYIPGRYEGLEQFAYKVRGPCMDLRRILNGDYVICVNYFEARTQLTDGDIVVVERRRGQMTERTCKELKIVADGYELWPRSSNPKFSKPIVVEHQHDSSESDGTNVEVVGLVVGRYSPI